MSAKVEWSGLAELRAQLRNLPADLTGEATHLAEAAANGAAVTVKQAYGRHRKTGHLQDAVTVTHQTTGEFGFAIVVTNSDPIAWLFDNGSQARHWAGGKRTGRMWGKTPPTHVFVQTMIRARRRMYGQLKDLLVRKGLSVSGDV